MKPMSVSLTGTGTSSPVPVDYTQVGFVVGVATVVTGTVTYSIQHTYDDVLDGSVVPTWFTDTNLLGKTAHVDGSFVSLIRAVRINIISGTGSVRMTVLQGNSR